MSGARLSDLSDGLLYFPVTPFGSDGAVETGLLREYLIRSLEHRPAAVFPACGTGELHAMSVSEASTVIATTAEVVAGRVPVLAGTGGPLGHALQLAREAAQLGADALLVLPPYLVTGPDDGLLRYVEAIADSSSLPVVVYHRGTARYTLSAMRHLAADDRVIGFKDGVGDIGFTQTLVRAVREAGRDDMLFFNGLLTAELTQGAYRGIGVPLYSSAAFAMAPQVATAYHRAYTAGDEVARLRLLDEFYLPLVALRDEVAGFGVALVKAGVRLSGLDVGGVRPPLVDPSPEQLARLREILERGRDLAGATERGRETGQAGAGTGAP